jgi:hypothetical protein
MATVHHNGIFVPTVDEHFGEACESILRSHAHDVRIMSQVSSVLRALESHPPAVLRKTLQLVVQFQECAVYSLLRSWSTR